MFPALVVAMRVNLRFCGPFRAFPTSRPGPARSMLVPRETKRMQGYLFFSFCAVCIGKSYYSVVPISHLRLAKTTVGGGESTPATVCLDARHGDARRDRTGAGGEGEGLQVCGVPGTGAAAASGRG
jgi:hypothetical protein